ncbi:20552_t:CDS:2, partial [Gigaspora margarita]
QQYTTLLIGTTKQAQNTKQMPGRQEILSEYDKHALVRIANNNRRAPLTGVGPLVEVKDNINSDSYINVLANYFVPWANSLLEKYPDKIDLIFQQDLAPIYVPDLNLIKNLWERLDLMLYKRRPAPETRKELVMCIKEEWYKMSLEYIRSLIC